VEPEGASPRPPTGAGGAALAILAGGRGLRMGGTCKSLLRVNGVRVIDRQLAIAEAFFDRIVVIASTPEPELLALGWPVIPDRLGPMRGPLAGLDAALAWLPEDRPAVVCVAADMPFLSGPLLARLRDHPAERSLVPRHADGVEPLCARYARSAADHIRAFVHDQAGTRALRDVVRAIDPDYLEEPQLSELAPHLDAFINLNRPSDLARAEAVGAARHSGAVEAW
jgi:molybdopterin-guanine dinucleotide biosynthesis protein A